MDRQFLYPCPKWNSQTDFGRELAAEVRTREHQMLGASCIDEFRNCSVMKRIATPIIGGVVTSAILELLIYPVIFVILAAAFVAEGHTR